MCENTTIRIEKQLKVTKQPQGKGYVPGFRIAGQYVERLGLKDGDFVDVVAENDLMIIKKNAGKGRTLAQMVEANPLLLTLIRAFSLEPDERV